MSSQSSSEDQPTTPPRRKRKVVSPSPSPVSSPDNIEAEVTSKYVCGYPVNEEQSTNIYIVDSDEPRTLYVTPSTLHASLVTQFTYQSMLTMNDIVEIRRRDNCIDEKFGFLIDSALELTSDNDPMLVGYYVSHALSKLHRNGILHLNVRIESVIYLNRPVLVGFEKAKLIQVEDTQEIPSDSNYLPPESGIVGYYTDIWALGIMLLSLYEIRPDLSDTSIYSVKSIEPIIREFFASDWTDKILDYYSDKVETDTVTLIYNDYNNNGKNLSNALSARYSKDSKLIKTIIREVGENINRKTITSAIKSANRTRYATKATKINTLLHSLLSEDYRVRPNADTVLLQIQPLLPNKLIIQGDTYESRVDKGIISASYVATLLNTLYVKCRDRQLRVNVLLHAFDYLYRLTAITEINNLDLVVDYCINIADNICNNTRHVGSILDDITSKLNYELFVSQIYSNALNINQVIDVLRKLGNGEIDYSTYRWEIIAGADLPSNKQSINTVLN